VDLKAVFAAGVLLTTCSFASLQRFAGTPWLLYLWTCLACSECTIWGECSIMVLSMRFHRSHFFSCLSSWRLLYGLRLLKLTHLANVFRKFTRIGLVSQISKQQLAYSVA
jgi:hypothetical protein